MTNTISDLIIEDEEPDTTYNDDDLDNEIKAELANL